MVMGQNGSSAVDEFKVGVVLDMDSLVAKMGLTSMSMALSDFYSSTNNSFHKRSLVLHTRDSNGDIVDAASEGSLSHIFGKFASAIISGQIDKSAAWYGIPLLVRIPMVLFVHANYHYHSCAIDVVKNIGVQAIIGPQTSLQALLMVNIGNKAQREVVPIYEDTEYGNGAIPYLTDAFQDIDTRVPYRSAIPPSTTDDQILEELYKLMITMQTRVFVVHMTPSLGLRVFQIAKMIGMMSEGYSWIITNGLANFLSSFNSSVIDSMQGVLGVRPYVPQSKKLDTFTLRWKKKFLQENPDIENPKLNIFCLWAYDTIWALASAIEKLETINSRFLKPKVVLNSSHIATLGVSLIGPKLLQEISKIKFKGLSDEFCLVDRQLQTEAFQILNVVGLGGREVGIWTPSTGILRDLNLIRTKTNSDSTTKNKLRAIIWPGESTVVPKGWVIPKMGKKLRIGVPIKGGFSEFLMVTRNNSLNWTYVTGYCIDVFKAVIEMLPYAVPYEFVPFQKADGTRAESYDDLIYQVYLQRGQLGVNHYLTTATPPTLPLQLHITVTASICPVWQLEDIILNNWGRCVVIIWTFVLVILSSCYTASLSSMLTVYRLEPTVTDVHELIKNQDNVGYLEGSFVFGMLQRMGFDESNLKPYKSPEDFDEAFSKLRKDDRIVAASDEVPYINLLLARYCDKYTMVGSKYKTS
ncbi:Ionotropic glutamate receptor [Macleaya cordata]|uniref:Ionotropic glutamate receptor n=1 Tax=Macleaya cordata TaxID=56857 RepID=A0A200R8M3_MACCD|nr:Ionotropic glutamate receptor [Macleaya cordata]